MARWVTIKVPLGISHAALLQLLVPLQSTVEWFAHRQWFGAAVDVSDSKDTQVCL